MQIEWAGSPNFRQGRNGKKPIAIVDHITAGLMPGCLSWLQNPAAQASAHYLITKTGRIIQLVSDENTAWHAGKANKPSWKLYDGTNPNTYTIGIEHESKGEGLTEEQYQATAWLHRHLTDKWKIPIDRDLYIIGHYQIDSVDRPNCPGVNFPWERLMTDLQGGTKKMPEAWKLKIIEEAKGAGLINEDHNPDEKADKWFVLAVALVIKKQLEDNTEMKQVLKKVAGATAPYMVK